MDGYVYPLSVFSIYLPSFFRVWKFFISPLAAQWLSTFCSGYELSLRHTWHGDGMWVAVWMGLGFDCVVGCIWAGWCFDCVVVVGFWVGGWMFWLDGVKCYPRPPARSRGRWVKNGGCLFQLVLIIATNAETSAPRFANAVFPGIAGFCMQNAICVQNKFSGVSLPPKTAVPHCFQRFQPLTQGIKIFHTPNYTPIKSFLRTTI